MLNFVKAIKLNHNLLNVWLLTRVLIVVPEFFVVLLKFDLLAFSSEFIPSSTSLRRSGNVDWKLPVILKSFSAIFPASYEGKTIQ